MKLFVIVSRVPYPLDKGDKLRVYHQLKELSKNNKVLLCCLDDNNTSLEHINHLKTICYDVKVYKLKKYKIYINLAKAIFSNKPYQVHYFYQSKIQKQIDKLIKDFSPERIFCQLIRVSEYVKNKHNISKTLDYMDAFSKGIDRRIPYSGFLKPLFKEEAKRLIKYEHLIFDYFDNHTIISKKEQQLIYHQNRNNIKVVTNGIDTNYFHSKNREKKYDIIFVGNMSYHPNIEAAKFLVNKIYPLLEDKITIRIAGANPTKEVLSLSRKNIEISGWVEDIREAYESAKIFVAPLFIGTGLQNKLLEAMSMELPCITTNLVNNTLGAIENQHLRVVNSAREFADNILELLEKKEIRLNLGKKSREFVKQNYSWQKSTNKLENIIKT